MPKLGLGLSLPQTRFTSGTPAPVSGMSRWFKADTGVTAVQSTYVSQIVLTCTGGFSSYSGTYIATSPPDEDGVYTLLCSANSKAIVKDGDFLIESDFLLASSGNGISWSLANVLVTGLTISGATGSYTGANEAYGLNERNQSTANLINDNGYNLNTNTSGVCEIYTPDNATLLYSNSSFGSGDWTNEGGTGTVTAESITLDPSGTLSGSVTTSGYGDPINVTAWADQGSYNQDLTYNEDDETVAPVLATIEGKNFVNFQSRTALDGDTEVFGSFVGSAFFVAQFPATGQSSNTSYLFTYGSSGPFRMGVEGSDGARAFFLGGVISSASLINDTTYLIGTTFNNPAVSLYLNGASVGSGNFSTSSSEYENFHVGGGTAAWDGAIIAEVIMYDSVLTTPERQQVEAYLNAKYAVY